MVVEQAPGMDTGQLVHQLAERFPARPARMELAGPAVDRTLQAVTTAVRDWAPTVLLIDVLPEPAEITR